MKKIKSIFFINPLERNKILTGKSNKKEDDVSQKFEKRSPKCLL